MKILQIFPGFTIGGPSVSVTALTRNIARKGHNIQLYAHENPEAIKEYRDLDIRTFPIVGLPFNKQLAFSSKLRRELTRECQDADIIQTNSLWQYPNFVMEAARKNTKAKSVIVPRGTLSSYALSISPYKKKLVLALGQRKALKNADMFIATCEKEYQDIRNFGLKQPVAIIPNGLDLPTIPNIDKKKQIIFLARIHKIKGVDLLIRAWKEIIKDSRFQNWELIIAGPTHSEYAQNIIKLSQDIGRISFVGEKFDEEKIRLMAESSIYVLPTHSENFGITVAEALACETPVITTTGAPWKGIENNNCGLWIKLSVENLTQSLTKMMMFPEAKLIEMGKNGREWISKDFSWDELADKTIATYNWLLDPISTIKPKWLLTD